jgi:hypothetical protein
VSEKPDDPPPDDCGGCRYHLQNGECRRHAPHPGHDERYVVALWHLTDDNGRCGGGSTMKEIVRCDDCVHWYLPGGQPLNPHYKQGLPAEWWQNARLCAANPPGATTHERLRTYWRVTSSYPIDGVVGGCGDGVSITALLEAEQRR